MKILKYQSYKLCFFVALSLLLLLTACGEKKPDPDEPVKLWVLTEATEDPAGMDAVIQQLADTYMTDHEQVTVRVEALPREGEERQNRISQIQTQIMAGKGPDVYLLPSLSLEGNLFADVAQAMRNGVFYDISGLYDADGELNKAALNETVMAAGLYQGHRFVLPLRYTYPAIFANKTALSETGVDVETMALGIHGYTEELLTLDSSDWSGTAWPEFYRYPLGYFPDIIDEETGAVTLGAEQVMELLRIRQSVSPYVLSPLSFDYELALYLSYDHFVITDELSANWQEPQATNILEAVRSQEAPFQERYIYAGELDEALWLAMVAKVKGIELTMFPLRGVDGSLTASVTYWGAVGVGSAHPELAYDFLRQMLTEEVQWERTRLELLSPFSLPRSLIEDGWPVYSLDAADGLLDTCQQQGARVLEEDLLEAAEKTRMRSILSLSLESGDIPLLDEPFDSARFPTPVDGQLRTALISVSTDTDINAVAQDVIDALQLHLDEG